MRHRYYFVGVVGSTIFGWRQWSCETLPSEQKEESPIIMVAASMTCSYVIIGWIVALVSFETGVQAWTPPQSQKHAVVSQYRRPGLVGMSSTTLAETRTTTTTMEQKVTMDDIVQILTESQPLPKLLVFDLDNTLWTPELYQIRQKRCPR